MNTSKSLHTQGIYTIENSPLTWRHWWITFVASLGQLIGTTVATIAGVIIPLLLIIDNNSMSFLLQGLIGSADLIGIMVGSVIFGKLSDRYGYLTFFRLCPAIILAFSLLAIYVPNVPILVISLFMIGLGIGGEYSLDSDYESVLMPDKWKLVMLGAVKTGAAFGNILAAGICFWLISIWQEASKWPDLMWIIAIVSALMIITRIYFFESPKWLMDHGQEEKALQAVHNFLGKNVIISETMLETEEEKSKHPSASTEESGFLTFCKRHWNEVVLSGIPWACEGLGVYGIGVFIPILVMALGIEHQSPDATQIMHVAQSVKTTLWISMIILPGFIIGLWMAQKKVKEVALQSWSFWACAISLIILLFSFHLKWPTWISLIAFMSFELFLNIGPHLVTYLLPPKIYPITVRGQGTGIAAAIGKAGATLGVFIVPLLLKIGGGVTVLGVSAIIMAFGAIITSIYGKRVFPKD
ncbi:MAG: MFS transporter [Muribaculaceae bacterium]|nr:MFS transporter [Muribaculaceae bacterium]